MTYLVQQRAAKLEGRIEGRVEGRVEGKAEGKLEEKALLAKKLLYRGYSNEDIVDLTDLPLSEIIQLRASLAQ